MRSPLNNQSGFTLLEMMVVLSIVAIVFAAGLSSVGRPSDRRLLTSSMTDVIDGATTARLRAISSQQVVAYLPAATGTVAIDACRTGSQVKEILFLPNGQARGDAFCLKGQNLVIRIVPDTLTGQLVREAFK